MVKREERNARILEQRRGEIVNAALAVFAQKGYAFATVDDIAREANVAVGTLYKYYKNKRDILMAVFSSQGLNQSFIKGIGDLLAGDEVEQALELIKGPIRTWIDDPKVSMFLVGELMRDKELRRHYAEEFFTPVLGQVADYIGSGQKSGIFRQTHSKVTARVMWGLMLGTMMVREIEGDAGPLGNLTVDELASEVIDFAFKGLISKEN